MFNTRVCVYSFYMNVILMITLKFLLSVLFIILFELFGSKIFKVNQGNTENITKQ